MNTYLSTALFFAASLVALPALAQPGNQVQISNVDNNVNIQQNVYSNSYNLNTNVQSNTNASTSVTVTNGFNNEQNYQNNAPADRNVNRQQQAVNPVNLMRRKRCIHIGMYKI
jgi:hypothetical protein